MAEIWLLPICLRHLALLLLNQTCTRASVNFVLCANSSLVYISGQCVLSNARSSSSNCSAVKVVRLRLCFLLTDSPGSESQSDSSENEKANMINFSYFSHTSFGHKKNHTNKRGNNILLFKKKKLNTYEEKLHSDAILNSTLLFYFCRYIFI